MVYGLGRVSGVYGCKTCNTRVQAVATCDRYHVTYQQRLPAGQQPPVSAQAKARASPSRHACCHCQSHWDWAYSDPTVVVVSQSQRIPVKFRSVEHWV